jgi:hypothetical protein
MIPADVFARGFDRVTAALEQWAEAQRDVARTHTERSATFWRLAATPRAPNAAAIELILHRAQMFDLAVGPETYEARRLTDLELFAPLLEAIAHGRIITLRHVSTATGATTRIETLVFLPAAMIWQDSRVIDARADADATTLRDRHFTPWTRAGAQA